MCFRILRGMGSAGLRECKFDQSLLGRVRAD